MPIYEYACQDCTHQFEHIQKFSDPLLTECPECGTGSLRKLVSATSFHLKGSGWYKDHYGLKSETPETKGGSENSSSNSASSSDTVADSVDTSSSSESTSSASESTSSSSEGDGGSSS